MRRTAIYLELALPAVSTSARRAREAVGDAVAGLGGDQRLADDVRICVTEAVTNVVRHAYAGVPPGTAEIVVERDDDDLNVVVRDTGTGMTGARRARSGGFGLKIIDKLTTTYTFRSRPSMGTEVRMVFRLGDGARVDDR